jgi:voltage-gated sodium channel
MGLVLLNAASMALQTYEGAITNVTVLSGLPIDSWFLVLDWIVLAAFSFELGAKLFSFGPSFLRDPWNLLDAIATAGSLVGQSPAFAVLRVLRLLRMLRQIHSMRLIVELLSKSISGCLSIMALMVVILFMFGLMGNVLFGSTYPELFGELHTAMYTLFRVANFFELDTVGDALIKQHPHAFYFLIPYFLVMYFVLLSFFAAIIIFYLDNFDFDALVDELTQSGKVDNPPGKTESPGSGFLSADQYRSVFMQVASLREEIAILKMKPGA